MALSHGKEDRTGEEMREEMGEGKRNKMEQERREDGGKKKIDSKHSVGREAAEYDLRLGESQVNRREKHILGGKRKMGGEG